MVTLGRYSVFGYIGPLEVWLRNLRSCCGMGSEVLVPVFPCVTVPTHPEIQLECHSVTRTHKPHMVCFLAPDSIFALQLDSWIVAQLLLKVLAYCKRCAWYSCSDTSQLESYIH